MNPYEQFVYGMAGLLSDAKSYPLGGADPPSAPAVAEGAPVVLILSPHPDDEVIVGALPLRLLRELGMRVVNVAVTLGSDRGRRAARLEELRGACRYLGFGLAGVCEGGLDDVNPASRAGDAKRWRRSARALAEVLSEHRPRAVFFPHDSDGNSTHVGTHLLALDALGLAGEGFSCEVVETEFWHPMTRPNLLVESSAREVVDLVTALTFHVGEVRRNPYHLRLPAWMMDNVRRGGETVGRQGSAPPDYAFATVYRLRRWENMRLADALTEGRFVGSGEDLSGLFGARDVA